MCIICECFHAGGKPCRIRLDGTVRKAFDLPAIVDIDVFISSLLHSIARDRIQYLLDSIFIDITMIEVPAVKTLMQESQTQNVAAKYVT